MPYGIYLSAAGAEVQNRRVQMIANNIANVDTPGFKRELALIQARDSEAIERGLDHRGSRSINDVGGGVELVSSATQFSLGTLKPTGQPTDLALDGEQTFFVVDREGEQLLTRAGNFAFTSEGEMRTAAGDAVLGEDGPIRIDPTQAWRVLEDGSIMQGNTRVARIRVEKPASLGDLVKVGANFFAPLAPTAPAEAGEARVLSGYLELSGVNPAAEMMEMIEAMRAFEANTRMIQHHDQVIGALVTRVLRQS